MRPILQSLAVLFAALLTCAYAQHPPSFDSANEVRATHLAEQLRCLVCQNQTIADSAAELAVDLRREIKLQMGQGRSDREILDFMAQRYGDFVLYRPPVKTTTLILWFGPLLLLMTGGLVAFRSLRQRRNREAPQPLSAEDTRHAGELLGSGTRGRSI